MRSQAATLVRFPEGEIPSGGIASSRRNLGHLRNGKPFLKKLVDKVFDMFVSETW